LIGKGKKSFSQKTMLESKKRRKLTTLTIT
jgi:hypothetical protein